MNSLGSNAGCCIWRGYHQWICNYLCIFNQQYFDVPHTFASLRSFLLILLNLPPPGQSPRLRVHGSSVLFRSQPQLVVFHAVQQSDQGWYEMQGVTAVQPEWLESAAPHMYTRKRAS